MATRRPSVPKAQFPTGIGSAQAKPQGTKQQGGSSPDGTTPDPGQSATPTARGGATGAKKTGAAKGGSTKTGGRERQLASGPESRTRQDGVVHTADNGPVPARSFSGRLLVLGLAMGVVTLLLAPNVHTFLQQREEISALRVDIAAKQVQQDGYAAELARWDDPAYIKQQARDRVSMLMPGETGYWVYGANGVESSDGGAAGSAGAGKSDSAKNSTEITIEPWVESLWKSVQQSAQVQAPPKPAVQAPPGPAPEPAPADEPAPAG